MSRVSWLGLVAAVLVGLVITLLIRRKTGTLVRQAGGGGEAEAEAGCGLRCGTQTASRGASTIGGRRGRRGGWRWWGVSQTRG